MVTRVLIYVASSEVSRMCPGLPLGGGITASLQPSAKGSREPRPTWAALGEVCKVEWSPPQADCTSPCSSMADQAVPLISSPCWACRIEKSETPWLATEPFLWFPVGRKVNAICPRRDGVSGHLDTILEQCLMK